MGTKKDSIAKLLIDDLLINPIIQIKRERLGEIPKAILNTHDKVWDKKFKPLIIKRGVRPYKNGCMFIFKCNEGISADDFMSKINYYQSVVKGIVTMKYRDTKVFLDVNTFQFKKKYLFNAQELKELVSTKPKYKKMYLPVTIGVKSGGKPIIVDLKDVRHILFAGLNNSGKTSWVKQLMYSAYLFRPETFIIFIDFKGADMDDIRPIGMVTNELSQAKKYLSDVVNEMKRRIALFPKYKINSVHSLNSYDVPPILLVIDEITEMKDKQCQEDFNTLVRMSRAAGVSLIAGTQYPSSKTFKDFCENRTQFDARMAFRMAEPKDSRVVLNTDSAYRHIQSNCSGRGIWKWGDEKIIQSYFIDKRGYESLSHIYDNRREVIPFVNKYKQKEFWSKP